MRANTFNIYNTILCEGIYEEGRPCSVVGKQISRLECLSILYIHTPRCIMLYIYEYIYSIRYCVDVGRYLYNIMCAENDVRGGLAV